MKQVHINADRNRHAGISEQGGGGGGKEGKKGSRKERNPVSDNPVAFLRKVNLNLNAYVQLRAP